MKQELKEKIKVKEYESFARGSSALYYYNGEYYGGYYGEDYGGYYSGGRSKSTTLNDYKRSMLEGDEDI
ncbi:MAG: hypothetical protein QXL94_01565 [Candidatus Parvarchaeum sp.]